MSVVRERDGSGRFKKGMKCVQTEEIRRGLRFIRQKVAGTQSDNMRDCKDKGRGANQHGKY